jgi:hypothetical protein
LRIKCVEQTPRSATLLPAMGIVKLIETPD